MEALEPLTILLGGSGRGKTAAALGEYRRTLQEGQFAGPRRTLWLAPTSRAAADVREALARGGHAILDPGVTTFVDLAYEVVRHGRPQVRRLSSLQRQRLLERLVAEAAAEGVLEYFGPVAGSPGFLTLVGDWIADRKHRVKPKAARHGGVDSRANEGMPDEEPRTRDLVALHTRYEQALDDAAACDAEGLLWLAADVLREWPQLTGELELVVADGFSDFTPAEHELLGLVRSRSRRTWVPLVGEWQASGGPTSKSGREELWSKTAATIERLKRDGAVQVAPLGGDPANGSRVSPRRDESRRDSATCWEAIAHVERNLFRNLHDIEQPSAEAAASAERIHIIAASSVQAEIDEIARRVKRLLVDGARPGDIIIAFRSLHDVAERLRQALDDYGVPYWLDASRRLASTPLVRSLVGVLRLAADDWPYRSVLRVAGDSLLTLVGDDATRTAIERFVRQAQLPSGRTALINQIAAWAEAGDESADAGLAAAALTALRRLAAALDALPRRAGLAAWVAAAEVLAQELGLLGRDANKRAADAEAAAAWSSLVRGLHDIEQIDQWTGRGEAALGIGEFVALLQWTASWVRTAQPHDSAGRVVVLLAEAARFSRPKHLFLGGLSEQAFAAGATVELDAAGEASIERRRDAAADEMLLFYQVVTRAGETLTLSYPALDERAQPLVPSPMVAELERCLEGAPLSRTVQPLGYWHGEQATPALSRGSLRRTAVAEALDGRRELLAGLAGRVGGWSPAGDVGGAILDGIEMVASRARRDGFGAFEGLALSEAARQRLQRRFGADHLWSPSQLELYATCPFRFFGEQALKLEPAPELALADDLARRGHLLHDALARVYALRAASATAEDGAAAASLAEQFLAALEDATRTRLGRGLYAALREVQRRQIAAWAKPLEEQDAAYQAAWSHLDAPPTPTHFEARFGPRSRRSESADAPISTDAPYELVVPVGGREERVGFIGQIDRIDVGSAAGRTVFNVIDYKTSARAVVDANKVSAGTQLQLPLYAMAAAELLLADQNAAPLAAGYWSVRGKGFGVGQRSGGPLAIHEVRDGVVRPTDGWPAMRAAIIKRLGEIILGIRQGWFPVFNEDKECTSFCALRTVCRIAHVRSLEKEWTPPAEDA